MVNSMSHSNRISEGPLWFIGSFFLPSFHTLHPEGPVSIRSLVFSGTAQVHASIIESQSKILHGNLYELTSY